MREKKSKYVIMLLIEGGKVDEWKDLTKDEKKLFSVGLKHLLHKVAGIEPKNEEEEEEPTRCMKCCNWINWIITIILIYIIINCTKNKTRIKLLNAERKILQDFCEFGGHYTTNHKARHLTTNKHVKFIENQKLE
eukprot:gene3283-5725_t